MARVRLYVGKKQYSGYYDEVPLLTCVKKMKLQLSTWSPDPLNIPVQESMDALKGATVQVLEEDLEEDPEADPPKPAPPEGVKAGYYQVSAVPDKLSQFCRKNAFPFVEATWPN